MIEMFEQFAEIERIALVPHEEVVAMDLNLSGVNLSLPYKRVRFNLMINDKHSLMFSLENNKNSQYKIQRDKLFFDDFFLFDISGLVEDSCEVFYTRKNGNVLCFNPNNRSSCNGCRFCYSPTSHDKKLISTNMLFVAFKEWVQKNHTSNLSHLEQVAVVTGCFKSEQMTIDFLFKLRETLSQLGFQNEILYFGIISNIENIELLSKIKPLQLCFTVECFENREKILIKNKNIDIDCLRILMKKSVELGITTTFSYVLGLDSLKGIQERMSSFKNCVNSFPIVSLFQTDSIRIQYRHVDANNLNYYLQSRKEIENIFADTTLKPNSWNNYRSLWRTCYGKNNESILLRQY